MVQLPSVFLVPSVFLQGCELILELILWIHSFESNCIVSIFNLGEHSMAHNINGNSREMFKSH